jgi:F-type H+-transporting ATPase subunit b
LEGLFNPTTILLHMLNTAMLLAALYYLLYKPVRKFLRAREDKVAGQLDNAAANQKQAAELLDERQKQLNGAAGEVASLIKTGEAQGKARADAVVKAAQSDARQIADKAKTQVRIIEQNAQQELYEDAAKLSVQIASMVLEREVTIEDHKRLLQEFLEKAGKSE